MLGGEIVEPAFLRYMLLANIVASRCPIAIRVGFLDMFASVHFLPSVNSLALPLM